MSETLATSGGPTTAESEADPKRWWALAVISIAMLMVVLDATIINVALPHAQAALHISNANRQWVVTAYTLTFGGLLLLGGRIADYSGRKRAFMIGLVGFAAASALGGAAVNQEMLFTARAIQGVFGALLAPAALSLLTATFTDPRERVQAFGVYGAIAGGGTAIGIIAGGVLTEYLNWRWCLFVNAPVAVIAVIGAILFVRESRAHGNTKYDLPGATLITVGLALLVYGFSTAATDGWGATKTVLLLVGGAVLLVGFVGTQMRGRNPLLPLRIVTERNRGGAFLGSLLLSVGLFGVFLFMTYYLQGILGYSALKTGFAYLPMSLSIIIGSGVVTPLIRFVPPRALLTTGFALGAVGLLWFSRLSAHTGFWSGLFGPEVVIGMGMACIFVPITNLSLFGVGEHDSGVASGVLNATQQVGGSIGTALLNTVAASATTSYLVTHHGATSVVDGTIHGYSIAFLVAAGIFVIAAVAAVLMVNASKEAVSGQAALPEEAVEGMASVPAAQS